MDKFMSDVSGTVNGIDLDLLKKLYDKGLIEQENIMDVINNTFDKEKPPTIV